ncbi:MAG: hypothetical protein NUW37_02320 [Planctomycetes bacterium]|nr:hypothetical protein [Planctomycetota bacterium]
MNPKDDLRIEQIRMKTLPLLEEAKLLGAMIAEGMKPSELCRLLYLKRSDLEEKLAINEFPKKTKMLVGMGALESEHVHQLLRFNGIFSRLLENRDQDAEQAGEFFKYWIAYYQELFAVRYAGKPAAEMKSAVDVVYEASVGIMMRKFGSMQEMFLEFDTLKEGFAGFVARLKKFWYRLTKSFRKKGNEQPKQ